MWGRGVLRPISCVVLVAFTSLTLQPLTAAAQLPSAPKREPARSESGEERFSRTLNEIHEILKEVVPQAAMPQRYRPAAPGTTGKPGEKVLQAVGPKLRLESEIAKSLPGVDVTARVKTLRGKYKELKSLEAEVDKGFKATEKHLRDKNLPPEILARHEQAVAEYERRKAEFGTLMQSVEAAADGKGELQPALVSLGDFMAKYPNAKTHTPADPNNLPWGSPKPVTRAPYTSPAQFKTSRLFGETVKVAQAGSLSGIGLPNASLPATPNAGDLAATEDAQITQAIRDLAASLNNSPVSIYNWVRNNIQFIPSYGSIQGSDLTLQTRRGNAFDTASLLVALLRAAGVPARYIYGTIEVPADKAMNWVGGVTVPQAAQNLMGQGGIPTLGITQGGQVKWIRLEHVWVEAFVDYIPSRGAVNRIPNTWVPLDASFKQYQYTQGMNINANVPVDVEGLMAQAEAGAAINEQEGWIQGLNQTLVQEKLATFQSQLTSYVNAQKPGATVGDVLGNQSIVQENTAIFLGTLPYTRVATGAKLQALPENLRWKFRYNLYGSDIDRAFDSPAVSLERSTASLGASKITLSFVPASQADLDTVRAFRPAAPPAGSDQRLSDYPKTLPGYLIRVRSEVTTDGGVLLTGPTLTMGQELIASAAVFDPARGWRQGEDNSIIAGELHAVGLDLQGVEGAQISALVAELRGLQAQIATASDATALIPRAASGLLHLALSTYFRSVDNSSLVGQRLADMVEFRMPSFGSAVALAQPRFFFGLPRNVDFTGVGLDIDFLSGTSIHKANDNAETRAYRLDQGMKSSALESLVPQRLFTDAASQFIGVSAAKALALSSASGKKQFLVTAQNVDSVLPRVAVSEDVRQEIRNYVGPGREAVVSESEVQIGSWHGAGYLLLDTETGAGAYKIAGGANGGFVDFALAAFAQPEILVPTCAESFLQTAINNFIQTNVAIPGITTPVLSTILTASIVAESIGGMTLIKAIKLSVKNPTFLLGNLRAALITSMVNFILMSLAFEIGILIGSLISAAICRKN